MKKSDYLMRMQAGIDRLKINLDPAMSGIDPDACVAHIEAGTGDPYACKRTLHTYAMMRGLLAWFEDRDLASLKQWVNSAAKLRRTSYQERPGTVYYTPVYLMPLLSDNAHIIDWFKNFSYPFFVKGTAMVGRISNPRMNEYYHYNSWLALRGDWDELSERCRAFLSDVPKKQSGYQADSRFHLALAAGDVAGMEDALAELVEPKLMRRRQAEENGYTQQLICTFAVVYAKIAWRHGYQVKVDSPWVPKEWLPIAPLPKYQDAFAFMASLDDSMPVE